MTKRILCIDGRPDIVELVKDILVDVKGYAVLTRLTPYQDASEIEALHPDLVIVGLADSVGRETLKLLKRTTIPVLAFYHYPTHYFTKQDQELVNENTTLVREFQDLDDMLKIVEGVVESQKLSH